MSEAPLHSRAAAGDANAFAMLAACHRERGAKGVEPAIVAYARASDYARLAACSRGAHGDYVALIITLEQYGDALNAIGLNSLADLAFAEAITIAELMAEDGNEHMAEVVASCADKLSPETFSIACDLRATVKGMLPC